MNCLVRLISLLIREAGKPSDVTFPLAPVQENDRGRNGPCTAPPAGAKPLGWKRNVNSNSAIQKSILPRLSIQNSALPGHITQTKHSRFHFSWIQQGSQCPLYPHCLHTGINTYIPTTAANKVLQFFHYHYHHSYRFHHILSISLFYLSNVLYVIISFVNNLMFTIMNIILILLLTPRFIQNAVIKEVFF